MQNIYRNQLEEAVIYIKSQGVLKVDFRMILGSGLGE